MSFRFLFGDDIFISYSRADGATYAAGVANDLAKLRFSCRFDQWGTKAGKEIPKELKQALKRSAMLVIIGTPNASRSDPVTQEVAEFKRTGRVIIPIIFDKVGLKGGFIFKDGTKTKSQTLDQSGKMVSDLEHTEAMWAEHIEGLPLSWEKTASLKTGNPSREIINRIEKTFKFSRKDERLRRTSKIVAIFIVLLIGAGVIAGSIASMKAAEAVRKTAEAVEQGQIAEKAKTEAAKQTQAARDAQEEAANQTTLATNVKVEADKQKQLAETNKAEANRQQSFAEQKRREAETQMGIASSRRLASSALAHLDDGLDYSLTLSLKANETTETFEARSSLFAGLNYSPHLNAFLKNNKSIEKNDLAFSPDNRILVSGGQDGSLNIWELATKRLLSPPITLIKDDFIIDIAFSSDGKKLAAVLVPRNQENEGTVDKETAIVLLDTKTWQVIGRPLKPGSAVTTVALNGTGDRLAIAGFGGIITLWEVNGPDVKHLGALTPTSGYGLASASNLTFSGDGERLAVLVVPALWPGDEFIKSDDANVVLIWNIADQKLIGKPVHTPQTAISSITFSSDGKLLAAGTTAGGIVLRDLAGGETEDQVLHAGDEVVTSRDNSIIGLAIDKDKKVVASVTEGKTLMLWDVEAKKIISYRQLKATLDSFYSAAFSLDGKQLATVTDKGTLALWNVAPTLALGTYLSRQLTELKNIVFDPTRNILAASANGQIFLWNVVGSGDIRTEPPSFAEDLFAPLKGVVGVAFSKDGKKLASVGINGRIILWDWNGTFLKQTDTFRTGNFTLDIAFDSSLKLMVSLRSNSDIELWSVPKKKSVSTLPVRFDLYDQYFVHFALSPDDHTLAAIGGNGELSLWNVADPQHPAKLVIPLADDLTSLAFSRDGTVLATGSKSGQITIWTLDTLRPSFTLRAPGPVHSLAFSPDNKTMASGTESGFIDLWDTEARLSLGQIRTNPADMVSLLAFSHDNRFLASGGTSGVILWDVDLESWKRRAARIVNLAF